MCCQHHAHVHHSIIALRLTQDAVRRSNVGQIKTFRCKTITEAFRAEANQSSRHVHRTYHAN